MSAPDVLRTARLTGHRVTLADLPYMIAMDTDPEVARTLFGIQTLAQSQDRLARWVQMWKEHGFGFWIFCNPQGEPVGHAGLFPSRTFEGSIEIGYALKPQYWNKGFATEMTAPIVRCAFEVLKLEEIIGVALRDNLASRRVLEKCGLRCERDFTYADGSPSVLYRTSSP